MSERAREPINSSVPPSRLLRYFYFYFCSPSPPFPPTLLQIPGFQASDILLLYFLF